MRINVMATEKKMTCVANIQGSPWILQALTPLSEAVKAVAEGYIMGLHIDPSGVLTIAIHRSFMSHELVAA